MSPPTTLLDILLPGLGETTLLVKEVSHFYTLSSANDTLHTAVISQVEFGKTKGLPGHEYARCLIKSSTGQPLGSILVERTFDSQIGSGSDLSLSLISQASSSSPSSIPALDRAVVSSDSTPMPSPPGLTSVSITPTSILSLMAIVLVLNEDRPAYDLFQGQCYWFAGLVFRFLVGPDADNLKAGTKKEMKEYAEKYNRPLKAGTFGEIFDVVTERDIEGQYQALKPKYEAMFKKLSGDVLRTREPDRKLVEVEGERDRALAGNQERDRALEEKDRALEEERRKTHRALEEVEGLKKQLALHNN